MRQVNNRDGNVKELSNPKTTALETLNVKQRLFPTQMETGAANYLLVLLEKNISSWTTVLLFALLQWGQYKGKLIRIVSADTPTSAFVWQEGHLSHLNSF